MNIISCKQLLEMDNPKKQRNKKLDHEINRIKELHKSGLNFNEIEKQTGFNRHTISKYVNLSDQTLSNKKVPKRDIGNLQVVTALEFFKTNKPSMTYKEIQNELKDTGICSQENVPTIPELSKYSVHDLGYTYKKLQKIPKEGNKDHIQHRFDEFVEEMSQKNPSSLHFFDESSVIQTNGNRNYGCSLKGSRAFEFQRYASNANFTINLLHSRFGVDFFNILEGPSNSLELIDFFRQVLDANNEKIAQGSQPILVQGDTIVMDNCGFHHSNIVKAFLPQMLGHHGVSILYQPPYHPQLNTCEYCFNIVKQVLKNDSNFTFSHTELAISDAIIEGITLLKSENIFKHCGYIQ